MSQISNLLSDEVILGFKQVLGSKFIGLNAYSGHIALNSVHLNISLGVKGIFTFGNEKSVTRFLLDIQGDDLFVKDRQHIGLKFEVILTSFFDISDYRFSVDFPAECVVQQISFWSFEWRDSNLPKLINVVIVSLQNKKNVFIHLGTTSDVNVLIREQSIEDYFEEKNKFYDAEFELIEIYRINQ